MNKKLFNIIILGGLAFIILLSGCAHKQISGEEARQKVMEEMRAYIKKIPDSNRSEQLLMLLDTLKQDIAELNQTVHKFGSDMRALNTNYDATRKDFRKILDDYNATRKELQRDILTTYFKMKKMTTPEEWKALAKLEEKALLKNYYLDSTG